MTDILNNNYVSYFLDVEQTGIVGNVTDTIFEEDTKSSNRIQISDINIEFDERNINFAGGIVPLDIGGISVSTELKDNLIKTGCNDSIFRTMTLDGKANILHQLVAPGSFKLLNKELPKGYKSDVYRGPIDNIDIKIKQLDKSPIGCLHGREDYQEIFILGCFLFFICQKLNISNLFSPIPLYNGILNAALEKDWNFKFANPEIILEEKYLNLLRKDELFLFLEYAESKKDSTIGEAIYTCLKRLPLPMSDKKKALLLYKKILNEGGTH